MKKVVSRKAGSYHQLRFEQIPEPSPRPDEVVIGVHAIGIHYEHLRRAGKLVIYGFHTMLPKKGGRPKWPKLALDWLRTPRFNPLNLTNDSKSVLAFNLSYLFDRTDLLKRFVSDLRQWIEEGKIQAPPVTEYAFEDVARAHADIESGMTVGKLVLIP